jgi:hypothetical protein
LKENSRVATFRVEPELLQGLAGRFGDLVSEFEALGAAGLDIGDTGDGELVDAIERFIERSRAGVAELTQQFDQVRQLLAASAMGYDHAETHVETGIAQNLESAGGPIAGSIGNS